MHCSGDTYKIRKGDQVTFTTYLTHMDPEVFPEPEEYRWVGPCTALAHPVSDAHPCAARSMTTAIELPPSSGEPVTVVVRRGGPGR